MLICIGSGERPPPHRRRSRRLAERAGELGARAHAQRPHSPHPARPLHPLPRADARKLGGPAGGAVVPAPPPADPGELRRSDMRRGANVVRYQGKRGAVWRIRYRDAAGRQVQETLGPEPEWTERKAQRELGKRLAAVQEGFRKPDKTTFAQFADRFVRDYLPGRNLKQSTTEN